MNAAAPSRPTILGNQESWTALFSRTLLCALVMTLLASCGGGGGGSAESNEPERVGSGWITVESATGTNEDEITLGGSAFISPRAKTCCSRALTDTGVFIQWFNFTLQEAGGVEDSVRHCSLEIPGNPDLYSLCEHSWRATIRLAVGANKIQMVATDGFGNVGRRTVTVTGHPDVSRPIVRSTTPAAGATAVAPNVLLTVTFSEAMDPATVSSSTILVKDPSGNPVGGGVSYANGIATFAPLAPLRGLTAYVAQVGTGVKDVSGNALAATFTWSFTTAALPDTTPPSVISTSPANAETCVAADIEEIVANFSEPVWLGGGQPNWGIRLQADSGKSVEGTTTLRPGGLSASLTLDATLADATSYTAVLPVGVTDFAGNALARNYSWTFETRAADAGTWAATSTVNAPSPRYGHTATWSGTELIVWGGLGSVNGGESVLGDGGRYNPATNSWRSMSIAGAPLPRQGHSAVWTGSRLIIWGGASPFAMNSGALYDPDTDSWKAMSVSGAPSARAGHTAVWTGNEMIVWGAGVSGQGPGDGARYDPATDTWRPISATGAPTERYGHTTVWDGIAMHVWGGNNGSKLLNDGASYSPSTDTWGAMASDGAPAARHYHSAVWAGGEMIIWGGYDGSNAFGSGARFSPSTNTWRPMNPTCSPLARYWHQGVWTGTGMVVWGGANGGNGRFYSSGGRYDPAADTWSATSNADSPEARVLHSATWTGTDVIVWGGLNPFQSKLGTGMKYRPQ